MSAPHRIDVHHHPSPPSYLTLRGERDHSNGPQQWWSVAKSIEDMDKNGVATSVLSLPHAAAHIFSGGNAEARRVVREWNEFMAALARDYPGRFGVFAALPILDIDGSLAEVAYAFDTLKADGVCLMTNIGDRWLGDAHYAPVFEELNRRSAVVYTHPVASNCCRGILPEYMDAVIEYGTDSGTYNRPPLASEGCVVLPNKDLQAIGRYITLGQTPVIIGNGVEWLDATQWQAHQQSGNALFDQWLADWRSLNTDNYLKHYSASFSDGKKNFRQWSKYKQRVAQGKTFIDVNAKNVSLLWHPNEQVMVATYLQNYASNNFSSQAWKRQYWQKETDGVWRIIHEGEVPAQESVSRLAKAAVVTEQQAN